MKVRCYQDPLAPDQIVRTSNPWISDAAYREVVEKMVVLCTDVVLTVKGDQALYLGKRSVFPMKGVWVFGGRMMLNDDSPVDSIARCVETEMGLKIETDRFELMPSPHLYSCVRVAQGDFGGKSLAFTFKLEVTKEELESIEVGLSPTEYNTSFGIQRFTRERLVSEEVHPMLIDLFDGIFAEN